MSREINKFKRYNSFFIDNKVDRNIVSFYRHFKEIDEDNNVTEYVNWARASNLDFLIVQVDGYDGLPISNRTNTIVDFKNLPELNKNNKFIVGQVDRIKRISEKLKDEMPVLALVYTPFNNIMKTMKYEFNQSLDLQYYWNNDRKIIVDVMEWAEKFNEILIKEIRENTKASGVMVSLRNGGKERIETKEYKKELLPWDANLIEDVYESFPNSIVHICGDYGPNDLSIWEDIEFKVINWDMSVEKLPDNSQCLKIENGKNFFGNDTVLMGGFDNQNGSILYDGTRKEIENEVNKLSSESNGQPFIISSHCSVKDNINPVRIRWIVEATKQ